MAAAPVLRDLRLLPKAHLHLHFSGCVARRETLEALARSPAFEVQKAAALEEAEREVREAEASGLARRAEKYRRRAALLSSEDVVAAAFGPAPPPRGASEEEELASIRRLDGGAQPGAAGVWDAQWVADKLVQSDPEKMLRILRELYMEAEEEGILWVELCAGIRVKDGVISEEVKAEWRALLQEWRRLEAAHRVGVRFVVGCPERPEDAHVLMDFLEQLDGREAVPHCGQWGREELATKRAAAYAVCHERGLRLACVHAGEGALQAACPSGEALDEEVLASYDGPGFVAAAASLPGIRRIGHGIEAAKSDSLMAELAARGDVCLEICPISNRQLRCCEAGLATHPLRRLRAAGVPCCLSADDPAFFGARNAHGLLREFLVARHLLGFSDEDLAALARASFEFSAAPAALRAEADAAIGRWLELGA